jgi:hypothetical protein
VRALRNFTQASLNQEPEWRRREPPGRGADGKAGERASP